MNLVALLCKGMIINGLLHGLDNYCILILLLINHYHQEVPKNG